MRRDLSGLPSLLASNKATSTVKELIVNTSSCLRSSQNLFAILPLQTHSFTHSGNNQVAIGNHVEDLLAVAH
jgi:hypothetical protein